MLTCCLILVPASGQTAVISIKENDVSLVNINFNLNLNLTSATLGGEQTPFNVTFQENVNFFALHIGSNAGLDFDDDGAKRWEITVGDLWPISVQLSSEDIGGLFGFAPRWTGTPVRCRDCSSISKAGTARFRCRSRGRSFWSEQASPLPAATSAGRPAASGARVHHPPGNL